MTITAKFSSKCPRCGERINEGEKVEWERGSKARHLDCEPSAQVAPEPERKDEVTVVEPGVYENAAGIFVVKPNRERTRLYAKRLVEINAERATESGERVQVEFEYAPGAIYGLAPEDKMPLERAKELTIRYGRCIVCSRHLKAAESVERGIGPVCIKSFAH